MTAYWKRIFRAILNRDHEAEDVAQMHRRFSFVTAETPGHVTMQYGMERVAMMAEELEEFRVAVQTQDLVDMADALVDLVYFAKGTVTALGLTRAWPDLWDDVHRANMEKVGRPTARGRQDLVKPPGWQGPVTHTILHAHGYMPPAWRIPGTTRIDERKCRDSHIS